MPKTTTEHYRYRTVVTKLEIGDGIHPTSHQLAYARYNQQKIPKDCDGLYYSHWRILDDGNEEFTWFEDEHERDKYASQTDRWQ